MINNKYENGGEDIYEMKKQTNKSCIPMEIVKRIEMNTRLYFHRCTKYMSNKINCPLIFVPASINMLSI